MATPRTTAQLLADAKEARNNLRTGRQAIRVRKADFDVTYNQANRQDLDDYIAELEGELAKEGGTKRTPTRRAHGFRF